MAREGLGSAMGSKKGPFEAAGRSLRMEKRSRWHRGVNFSNANSRRSNFGRADGK
jgi:hypothetical protein